MIPAGHPGSAQLRSRVLILCCLAFWPHVLGVQEQSLRPTERVDLKARSEAVVVDLVARDDRGRPVNDLRPEEIQIFENGEKQEIRTLFSAVHGLVLGTADVPAEVSPVSVIEAGRRMDARSLPGMRLPDLLILVFDELGPESRVRAREAALRLVSSLGESAWACVFKVGRRLVPLAAFSQDPEALHSAIELAASSPNTPYPPLTSRLQEETDRYIEMVEEFRNSQGALGGLTAQASSEVVEIKLQEMLVNMLRFQDAGQEDQRGGTTLHNLMAVVRGTSALEGRKSLLYFSDGLQLTSNLDALYQGLIDMANRHNVSIYAFDAGGLRTERPLQQAGVALRQAGDLGRLQQQTLSFFSTVDEIKLVDISYDTLGMDSQGLLHEMSERTGGFATVNSNDLRIGLTRVLEDVSARYELAYVPTRQIYDGSYRRIEVRVNRPKVEVQARDGYYAVPPAGRFDVLPFEIPLLARLNREGPDDRLVAVEAAALRFGSYGNQRQAELVLEFPLADLHFESDAESSTFRSGFACLLLVKDSSGEIVEKFSQEYPLRGPLENLESLRKGQVIFIQEATLNPGRYLLQAAVSEKSNGKMGTVSRELEIPESSGLEMSSITLIRQSQPYTESETAADDPLRFQQSKIVPNVAGLLDRKTDPNLLFFLNVYPDSSLESGPELTVEFFEEPKNGKRKLLASMKPPLPAADPSGRISFVYGFPVALYKPGRYLLRAEATQSESRVEETLQVVLK